MSSMSIAYNVHMTITRYDEPTHAPVQLDRKPSFEYEVGTRISFLQRGKRWIMDVQEPTAELQLRIA